MPNVGLNAVAGRDPLEYGVDALAFEEMRPGCYDIDARIDDMNVNGVLGSLNFPSLAGFCGQLFSTCDDKDIAIELLRAYNDWHVEDWCGTHPGRMIPLSVPPIWDVELMAAEIRRMADKGCHAVTFSENPEKLGYPSWHSDHWDPFLQACEEVGTVICVHIGSSSQLTITAMDAPIDTMITLQPMNIVQAAADLVWSPVFRKFPTLQGGALRGWHRMGALLPRADRLRLRPPPPVDQPGLRRQAPERGVQRERPHLLHRRRGGHGGAAPPEPAEHPLGVRLSALGLDVAELAGDGDEVPGRVCPTRTSTGSRTAMRWRTSPTTRSPTSPREQATVGALRALATDVDTTPVSHGTGKFQDDGIVTAMTLAERLGQAGAGQRVTVRSAG